MGAIEIIGRESGRPCPWARCAGVGKRPCTCLVLSFPGPSSMRTASTWQKQTCTKLPQRFRTTHQRLQQDALRSSRPQRFLHTVTARSYRASYWKTFQLACGAAGAVVLLQVDTIVASFYTAESYFGVLVGLLAMVAGVFFASRDFPRLGGTGLTVGLLHLCTGVVSVVGETKMHTWYVNLSVVGHIVITAVAIAGAAVSFDIGASAEQDVASMSDLERAELRDLLADSGLVSGGSSGEEGLVDVI